VGVEKINSGEQHLELAKRQFATLFIVHGPWKTVLLKSFNPEAKTVAVPVQGFQAASVLIAEQIQMSVQGVLIHLFLHHHRKAVDLLAHVGDARSYEYPDRRPVDLHRITPKIFNISLSVSDENPTGTEILMVSLTVISIRLFSSGSPCTIAGEISWNPVLPFSILRFQGLNDQYEILFCRQYSRWVRPLSAWALTCTCQNDRPLSVDDEFFMISSLV